MEILAVILVFVGIRVVWNLFFAGARVAVAGVKSAVTGESFDEAMGRIGPMESRLVEKKLETDDNSLSYFAVEVRGLFPILQSRELTFTVSVIDNTDGDDDRKPVLSTIDHFQEETSKAYFCKAEIGRVSPDQGFIKWIEIGRIFPTFIQSPISGKRKLDVIIRLIDADLVEKIHLGFSNFGENELFWLKRNDLSVDQTAKGYREFFEETKECLALTVKLAMAVAMADGTLDDSEGKLVKEWMVKAITPFSEDNQKDIKSLLNSTMKQAYSELLKGEFSKSKVVERFNEIGDDGAKFVAMELCYDVMAADGVADEEEIHVIRRLGVALELDVQELEKIRDMKMMNISSSITTSTSSLLGIDPDWNEEEIKKYLRDEFKKWNARLNNLEQGPDREHAQKMLDLIGEERQKYD